MPSDRFIRFGEKRPAKDEIQFVVEDYFHGIATSVEWDRDRFVVSLPGMCRHPLKRVLQDSMSCMWKAMEEDPQERWIEVWLSKDMDSVDVMTRMQDEVVCAMADGLVKLIARWWGGKVEDE